MKVEKMKNYEYEDWLDSFYLTADYTDDEFKELYEICMKNKSFEIEDEQLPF